MHKRLIEEGFNRRYVLLPLLLSIALVILGFSVTEMRRAQTRQLDDELRQRQDILRLLGEVVQKSLEAESAQRGFLVTLEEQYLAPVNAGLADARSRLDELAAIYQQLDPEQVPVIERVRADLADKAEEMLQTVALAHDGERDRAVELVKADVGLHKMQAIAAALEELRERERRQVLQGIAAWDSAMQLNTIISFAGTVFTIAVLVVLGLLATRDIRRREGFATLLAREIDQRTAELRDLSRHMSRVAEAEKHALARELHDELGGLLVAMRMDISQIRKRLPGAGDPELRPQWERIDQALSAGLELKRRVIEELRPTLLDNMGLFAALRWLATQRSEQAQLQLTLSGLEDEIELSPETAIAVLRTVQEAVSNIVKHAGATHLAVVAEVDASHLTVKVSDDGRGVPPDAEKRNGAHGLKQMRFRMESVGGTLHILPRQPSGTTVELSVPLEAEAEADA
ncbi:MAG: CHASE3 domain-containing protein [Pseudomonadota bacterium]|jgi:signal transduction histidine kinase|nr:MAG: hypothetical protein DIU62_11845 [Pseudomonadota bacterium]